MKNSYNKKVFDRTCVQMLERILAKKSTVKTEIYKQRDPKAFHRLLHTVVENYDRLLGIVKKCKYEVESPTLAVIHCYQIIERQLRNTRMRRKFMSELNGEKLKLTRSPVFFRINTLKEGRAEDLGGIKYESTSIPQLYHTADDIHGTAAYKEGKIVVQSLASCLPALVLDPEEGSVVVDTCAAPGNKTSHMAMLMNNTGKIYAYEMDKRRCKVLQRQLEKFGVTNAEVINADFVHSDPAGHGDVRYILCDPSCSGSGVHLNYKYDERRVRSLRAFQIKIVRHALKFKPEKLVYSVCSIHKEEGEEVVEAILKDTEYELEDISKHWVSGGYPEFDFSSRVIRCSGDSGTAGFFIALLVRKS
jgi:25S rRNA (cytosine2278-C5)-methyltransferase